MPKCPLCNKCFPSESKLLAHKNRKKPCNMIDKYECNDCNKIFKYKSKLEEHNKTKTHITNVTNNIQIANNITNNFNNINNYYMDVIMNAFEKTNLNKLSITDIENIYYDNRHLENIFKAFEDEGMVYPSNEYFVHCFNYFIKIFTKLNFNIAYSENHNCRCISFKRINTNVIEYQILSIDNITTNHKVACLIDGKKLKYINPIELQSYDCDEEVYVIESIQINLRVTKNHRMYVSGCNTYNYKIEEAQDIFNDLYDKYYAIIENTQVKH